MALPTWACATAIDSGVESNSLSAGGDDGESVAGSAGSASPGAGSSSAGKGGTSVGAGGAANGGSVNGGSTSGGSTNGGAASSAGSGSGKGGTGSAGAGSAGKGGTSSAGAGSAGKGGTSSAGSGNSAGKGGTSGGGATNAGGSTNVAGATGSATCDAAHAVATITTGMIYTGKATDCVRLAVNPTWSNIALQFQPMPGTAAYPVPFSFFSCGGNGTGSLTADYASVIFKNGANPGCDFFVQFGGGGTTVKVTYYD